MMPLFSVIVPHRNAISLLPKLFSTIPDREDIEIILVDNSPKPITKQEIGIDRRYSLLYSSPSRRAGGARNVGIENAHGKWLIFADADDYFAENAFSVFDKHADSNADVIFFCADSIYIDTGAKAQRGAPFTMLVKHYIENADNDIAIRTRFEVPWGKMIKKELVDKYNIRFDEVIACNDTMFSTKVGCNAISIDAEDVVVYVVTDSGNSISKTCDKESILSRFNVYLKKNKYLKSLGYGEYQNSIMLFIIQMARKNPFLCLQMIIKVIQYHQNPFIGYKNWIITLRRIVKHHGRITEDWK